MNPAPLILTLVVQVAAYGELIDDREVIDRGYYTVTECLYKAHKIRQSWEEIEHAEIIFVGCKGGEDYEL